MSAIPEVYIMGEDHFLSVAEYMGYGFSMHLSRCAYDRQDILNLLHNAPDAMERYQDSMHGIDQRFYQVMKRREGGK